jgi:protein phosphatase
MALGPEEDLLPDIFEKKVGAGDAILLCSDGLSNMVSDEEITAVLKSLLPDGDAVCERLISLANDKGGADNITVVLLLFA